MKIKTYQEALDYLEGFIEKVAFKFDKEFIRKHDPLERMRIFLSLLGDPQGKFKSVLVGGTSGKGSTSYLISHILTTAGYKTGLTISPHLQKINERLQINGKEISDSGFTEMVASMIRIIEAMRKTKVGAPSYFEILVGMAFKYFADEKVDIAVVEVGMGGEFDGTNTLNPLVAVLTNVSLDHTHVLGNTVEKIAKTKAGIIKGHHLPVVTGVKQLSVIKIVEERCKRVGSRLNLLWRDFGYKVKKESATGVIFDFISHEETLANLRLSLLGQYQAENASLGIKTILELEKVGFKTSENAIRKALKTAFFPGRFEIINITRGPVARFPPASAPSSILMNDEVRAVGSPSSRTTPRFDNFQLSTLNSQLVLDGAHNPTKMRAFLTSLKKLYPKERKAFIIGFKFDKDIKKMLKDILGAADKIIVTQFRAKTDSKIYASADASDIKNQILKIKKDTKVSAEKDSKKALNKALGMKPETIVVTGSLYLVGEIRDLFF